MIVIGVDGSDVAKEALRLGLHEASIRGTRVRAVYAWMPSSFLPATGPGMVPPLDIEPYREASEEVLRTAVAAVAGEHADKVERVVAVHDVGRAVNPQLCAGQIEGSVHMGLGYALTEEFPTDPATGFPQFSSLRQLGILRAKDVPAIDVELVEVPQPKSPYGIKGVGEIGLVPTAGAVAAAIRAHDGTWHNELPMRNDANRERASAWS